MREHDVSRGAGERGSALMIVMILAAVVAIMLYRELPVAAFEAQREKEQQLIDRGREYTQAVRLYVRRIGSYPPSFDALEDTNRIRFLRRRFKDPFTGKANWRLLHTGPGGMLIDSKLKPSRTNRNVQDTSQSNSNPENVMASSILANFSQPSAADSDSSASGTIVIPLRQRPPAIRADKTAIVTGGSRSIEPFVNSPDPTASLLSAASVENVVSGESQLATTLLATPQPIIGQFGPGLAGVASRAEGRTIKTISEQTDYSLWEFYYDPLKDPFRLAFGFQQNPWAAQTAAGSPGTKGAPGTGTSASALAPLQTP